MFLRLQCESSELGQVQRFRAISHEHCSRAYQRGDPGISKGPDILRWSSRYEKSSQPHATAIFPYSVEKRRLRHSIATLEDVVMAIPSVSDVLDFAEALLAVRYTDEVRRLLDRHEAGEITLQDLVAAVQCKARCDATASEAADASARDWS